MENNFKDISISSICFCLNLLTLDVIGAFEEVLRISKAFKMSFIHFHDSLGK